MDHSIVLEDLTIRYGTFTAVDGLSLAVRPGEVFGLLGPNGAGKTTTFLCLTHQVAASAGRALMLGHDLARDFDAVKPRFGYVPDVENHFDELSAGQNLRIFADLYRVDHAAIDACLDRVELLREKHLPVRAFSKGMRKKLLLARELLHAPEVLLLDDPLGSLDPAARDELVTLLRELGTQATVVMTTDQPADAKAACDLVAVLEDGHLVTAP